MEVPTPSPAEWTDHPLKLVVARFPQTGHEHVDVTDYLISLAYDLSTDNRVGEVLWWKISDTPVTLCRNRAARYAQEVSADLLLMIDNDMSPDLGTRGRKEDLDPHAEPFFGSSLEFWLEHRRSGKGPCVIAAPYCSSPPYEGPLVARWKTQQNDSPEPDFLLKLYTREEACYEAGITRVGALPTGLMLLDVEALHSVPEPYFYYEFTSNAAVAKLGTEDITFTRDLDFAGVPLYCNWDAWAGHWKSKLVRKPRPVPTGAVPFKLRQSWEREMTAQGRLLPRPPDAPPEPGEVLRAV